LFSGPCYFRLPGYHSFVLQNDANSMPLDTLVTVRPDVQSSLATDSQLLVGSYTITLLPGATFKIISRGFAPLAGRFLFAGEGDDPLIFVTRAFELHYKSGGLMLEITPDEGTYIAMRDKGDAFVKDLRRQVYDLKPGQEIYFPLFGEAKLKKRLSGFWEDPPTGFSAARVNAGRVSAEEYSESDEEGAVVVATSTSDIAENDLGDIAEAVSEDHEIPATGTGEISAVGTAEDNAADSGKVVDVGEAQPETSAASETADSIF